MEQTSRRLGDNLQRGGRVQVTVGGQPIEAYEGESVAAALTAARQRVFRRTVPGAQPRGLFCGIGVCFECLVTVDGQPNVRACVTPVREGMRITTVEP